MNQRKWSECHVPLLKEKLNAADDAIQSAKSAIKHTNRNFNLPHLQNEKWNECTVSFREFGCIASDIIIILMSNNTTYTLFTNRGIQFTRS